MYKKSKGKNYELHLKLNPAKDADIIAQLSMEANVQRYIKSCIRTEIENRKQELTDDDT